MPEELFLHAWEWRLQSGDLLLKRMLGKGHAAFVTLACLNKDARSPKVADYMQRQRALPGCYHPGLVAVKQFKGE